MQQFLKFCEIYVFLEIVKWLKGHSRFYHAQIIAPSVEDFCQMYAWFVEVILRLLIKPPDSLIITFCGFWDLITFCGYRNKSSGIFHFEWWSISLSPKVNTCSWDSFRVSFSDNLYLQHLALGSIRKGWVSASRLNIVASPDLCTEERRAGLPEAYQRWVQCWTIFAAQSLLSRRWF